LLCRHRADALERFNVVRDSPSANAHGSMPIGNGDVGINAWVEPSGDLVVYISKTDAWDENEAVVPDRPRAGHRCRRTASARS
jgi:hypothetical protein